MKPFEFATIGVRLIALGIISFGAVLLIGGILQRAAMTGISGLTTSTATVDLHLHDTYYVIAHYGFENMAPGAVCLVLGTILVLTSRRIARWLAYDFEKF